MARWEKRTFRLENDHGWTARDGYNVFIADRGAVRLDYPEAWIIQPGESGSMRFFDRAPPDDRCFLEVSYLQLRPIDWSGLPLTKLLKGVCHGEGDVVSDEEVRTVVRDDLELAWTEHQKTDPAEQRPALHRTCIARSMNVLIPHPKTKRARLATRPMIQALLTAAFWPEDAVWFEPVWDEALRSLQLGMTVASPSGPTRH